MAECREAQRSLLKKSCRLIVEGGGIVIWVRHPEWENGMASVWLWLEWVRVECRGIVLHIEIMQPIEIAQHEARSESRGSPFTCVAVDSLGTPFEPTT